VLSIFRAAEHAATAKAALHGCSEPMAANLGEVLAAPWLALGPRAAVEIAILRPLVEQGILPALPAVNRNCRPTTARPSRARP
jgi:hypothetical protein